MFHIAFTNDTTTNDFAYLIESQKGDYSTKEICQFVGVEYTLVKKYLRKH